MKSWSAMSKVVASRPATSTSAPAPNTMPLGLIRKMLPLAVSAPLICDTVSPVTRLSVTSLLF